MSFPEALERGASENIVGMDPIEDERHRAEMGAMIGESSSIGDNVIVPPGIAIGAHTRIKALKMIEETIPDGSLAV